MEVQLLMAAAGSARDRIVGQVSCAIALAACNPFPDLDALGGNGPSSDAGRDAPDAPDASAPDGAPANGNFCASSTHTFCADFDSDAPLNALWTGVGDGVTQVTNPSKSPPRAAHMTLPRSSSGAVTVTLGKDFDAAWGRTVLEFDVYMAAPAWQPQDLNIFIASLEFGPLKYWVWIDPDDLLGITVDTPDYHPLRSTSGRLQYGAWTHVRMTAVPSTTQGVQDLALGDPPVSVVKQDVNVGASDGRGVKATVGLQRFNPPTPAFEIYFDNVTVDLAP
jgi:hypothetical protein